MNLTLYRLAPHAPFTVANYVLGLSDEKRLSFGLFVGSTLRGHSRRGASSTRSSAPPRGGAAGGAGAAAAASLAQTAPWSPRARTCWCARARRRAFACASSRARRKAVKAFGEEAKRKSLAA